MIKTSNSLSINSVGIVTACNPAYFPGTQMLIRSLANQGLAHNIWVCGIGLNGLQKRWLKAREVGVGELDIAADDSSGICWSKPSIINQSPFQKVVWIDSDCLVIRDIMELLRFDGYVSPYHPPIHQKLFNQDLLYEKWPVPKRSEMPVQNGVIVIDKSEHEGILREWTLLCNACKEEEHLANLVSYFDQGAFLWAIEKSNKLDIIGDSVKYNTVARNRAKYFQIIKPSFVQEIRKKYPKSHIVHWAGRYKLFTKWVDREFVP
jgi:hypothetical protein